MVPDSRSPVESALDCTIRRPIRKPTCLPGIRTSTALRLAPMAAQSQGQVGTMTFDCGTPIRENICERLKGIRVRSIALLFRPNGRTLASGSRDGTVLLWQLSSSTAFGVEPLARGTTTLGNIKRTALLQNYPNPFNPETWIPYQLARDGLVTLTIYHHSGHIVRTLDIGRQRGPYRDYRKAAYWDARDQYGEPVTSGTYFYQLRAEDYTALRQMVIVK